MLAVYGADHLQTGMSVTYATVQCKSGFRDGGIEFSVESGGGVGARMPNSKGS